MAKIDSVDNLDIGEVAYVVELLAAMNSAEEVKNKLLIFSEGKIASPKTITKISIRYSKLITERNKVYLKNIDGNPLAHRRVRLDILHRIVKESLVPRPSHSVRVGDEFEMVQKSDMPSALKALQLALNEMAEVDKLNVLKNEAGQGDEEIEDYEADNGIRRLYPQA